MMMSEVDAEIFQVGHADSSPDVEFTMAEAEEEVLSVECEATPTDEPTKMINSLRIANSNNSTRLLLPNHELESKLHEARAREESTRLFWLQEVWRNQRAAEACGGTDYSYGGRVREQRLERKYKEDLAHRKKWTKLLGGQ